MMATTDGGEQIEKDYFTVRYALGALRFFSEKWVVAGFSLRHR
jgi:hypothetical protein